MNLLDLLRTPSSLEGDAWGFAKNAAGHTLIVGALPALLFPEITFVMLFCYAVWEFLQWKYYDAKPWDCFHDWAYVCSGALSVVQPLLLVPLLSFYVADILRRKK
jgi:hypothetical protein